MKKKKRMVLFWVLWVFAEISHFLFIWETCKRSHKLSKIDERWDVQPCWTPARASPLLLDCVMLATTLADITPISQIRKLSFKTIYVSFSTSLGSVGKSQVWDLNVFLSSSSAYSEEIILNGGGRKPGREHGMWGMEREINHEDRTQ